jgi:3-dehydroquinate synthase
MNRKITVQAEHAYDVLFGSVSPEVLEPVLIGVNNIAIVVPTDLAHLAKPLTELLSALGNIDKVVVIEVPEGEAQKNFTTVNDCWAKLGAENFRRNDLVIGLGGGATTDLAGFIAATWLRGIKWIAIPTSLAGMVDAAIGGKTGINTEVGKNLVGSFYSPQLVIVDVRYLLTLPIEELRAGMAEVIKCGFIADHRILEIIESVEDFYDPQSAAIIELIERAVQVKADVVSQDLKESFLREILNYGHTLAHAVERQEKYSWRHGDAVAVGMAFIVNLAMEAGLASEALVNRHISILRRADLPTSYPREAWPQLLNYMQSDKKSRGSGLRFVAVSDENSDVYKVVRLEGLADDILARAYERISS